MDSEIKRRLVILILIISSGIAIPYWLGLLLNYTSKEPHFLEYWFVGLLISLITLILLMLVSFILIGVVTYVITGKINFLESSDAVVTKIQRYF